MFLFYFGRDSDLSKLEFASFLKREFKDNYSIYFENESFCIIRGLPKTFDINKLGGTVRLYKLEEVENLWQADISQFDHFSSSKFSFTVVGLNLEKPDFDNFEFSIKNQFKNLFPKARFIPTTIGSILDPSKFFASGLDNGLELIGLNIEGKYFFGFSEQCADPFYYKKLDQGRPSRVFTHGTSIRLAKIMINILGLSEGSTILDPFCGTGTFLIQGLLSGYNVIGIDNNKALIESSEENIAWLKDNYSFNGSYRIVFGDARETKVACNGVVFEPFMGPFLKSKPDSFTAVRIMKDLNDLYLKTFTNLSDSLEENDRIVCILPSLESKDRRTVPLDQTIFEKTGFKLFENFRISSKFTLENPIPYSPPGGSNINRKIYILYKTT